MFGCLLRCVYSLIHVLSLFLQPPFSLLWDCDIGPVHRLIQSVVGPVQLQLKHTR